MAAANKNEARARARSVINKWAIGFASIAWIPFSHYAMTAGDVAMILQVGAIYGVDLNRARAGAIFARVAAPLAGSKIADSILDLTVIGWPVKSAVAAVVTKVVGALLIHYFHDCSTLPE